MSAAPAFPCPDCNGRGWRIVTQDGTRPPCLSCAAPAAEPSSPPGRANAAGHLPPAPGTPETPPAPAALSDSARARGWTSTEWMRWL